MFHKTWRRKPKLNIVRKVWWIGITNKEEGKNAQRVRDFLNTVLEVLAHAISETKQLIVKGFEGEYKEL